MMVYMLPAAVVAHLTLRLDRLQPGRSPVVPVPAPAAAAAPAGFGITPEPVDG